MKTVKETHLNMKVINPHAGADKRTKAATPPVMWTTPLPA